MTPPRNSPQVTLEQLIRVKRAERPAPDFWPQFERDLRTKQLAAIVEPRPWWAPFIRISARVAHYQLPVGATAILALTFLTVSEYRMPQAVDAEFSPVVVQRKIDTLPGAAVAVVLPEKHSRQIESVAGAGSSEDNMADTQAMDNVAQENSSDISTSDHVSSLVPMLSGGTNAEYKYSPAARMIAANLEAVRASSPGLVQMIERVSGMDVLLAPRVKTPVVDPLAKVRASSDNRRSNRLQARSLSAVSYSSNGDGERVSANQINRSLTEERLYDSISRFGVKADRVAFKF